MPDPALEQDITVINPTGLHARPASAIVMAVAASDCSIQISNPATGMTADGNSTIALLTLGAEAGTRLHIRVTGNGAEALLATIVRLFETGFSEK